MNLIRASYTNIWPFTDQTISIDFRAWSHLIQAPIGSGKSFLFFDGPLFGLYKYRTRPILNKQAKKWAVHVLFEADGQTRLIERTLTPTKKWGESIKTRLWSVNLPAVHPLDGANPLLVASSSLSPLSGGPQTHTWESKETKVSPDKGSGWAREVEGFATDTQNVEQTTPLLLNKHSHSLLQTIPTHALDPIEFTSSSECDQAILDLLPPREVTLSINFLMQASQSVFELAPADRVQVFKHLFGLIGIDDAKDKINEHRKELQTTINIKGDLTTQNSKLQQLLKNIYATYTKLTTTINSATPQTDLNDLPLLQGEGWGEVSWGNMPETPLFSDLSLISDQLDKTTLDEFSLDDADYARITPLIQDTHTQILHLTKLQWERTQIEAQLRQITTTLTTTRNEQHTILQQQTTLEQQLSTPKQSELTPSPHRRGLGWGEHERGEAGWGPSIETQRTTLSTTLTDLEAQIPFDAFATYGTPLSSSAQLDQSIASLLTDGKWYKQELENISLRITQLDTQVTEHKTRLAQLETQIASLEESHKQQNKFHCDKIEWNCPYIDMINTSASNALQKQKDTLLSQKTTLQTTLESLSTGTQKSQLLEQHASIEKKISDLKAFLMLIDRKSLQALSTQIKETQEQKKALDLQREQHLIKQQEQQAQKEHLIKLKEKALHLTQQITDLEAQHTTLQTTLDTQSAHDTQAHLQTLTQTHQLCETLLWDCQSLSALIADTATQRKQIKQLQEKLVVTKELYQIFSKELMTVVLQDFLPTLEEVLNSYLGQLVDYQVKFLTPTSTAETNSTASALELDIQIIDEKWTRSVKSLSWGQKTILKLVWMLWVATLFKSTYLMLDETINNLDTHTISQVAEVLEEFVTLQDIKFYVVTHSLQIQEMDIWSSVVHI